MYRRSESENISTEGKAVEKKELGHFSATEYVKRFDYVAIVVDYVSVTENIAQFCKFVKLKKKTRPKPRLALPQVARVIINEQTELHIILLQFLVYLSIFKFFVNYDIQL